MTGAQFEISIDGVPRTYRDRKELALLAAQILKSRNPGSVVRMKDLQTGEEIVIAFNNNNGMLTLPIGPLAGLAQVQQSISGSTREICRSATLVVYFSTRPEMPKGCATSRGSTFPPPAICGCDGSKPSRNSRFNTSERAIRKASFRLLARRSAALKKASPK
jgi:hypothetical protein